MPVTGFSPNRNYFHRFILISVGLGLGVAVWFKGLVKPEGYLTAALVIALSLLIFLPWLASSQRSPFPYFDLHPVFLGGVLALVSTSALVSINHHQTLLEMLRLGSYLAVGLVCYHMRDKGLIYPFMMVLIFSGVFYALYGYAQAHDLVEHAYWANPGEVASRLVNGAHFAGYLLIPLMSSIGLLFSSARWPWKVIPLLSLPILGNGLLMAHSRSGWLCALLCLFVYGGLMLGKGWKSYSTGHKILLGVAIPMVFALGIYCVPDAVSSRIAILGPTKFQSLMQRWEVWETAGRIVLNYPLGVGGGNFVHISSAFKVVSNRFLFDFAHNELLQIAVEYGLLGLFLVVVMVLLYLKGMGRYFRTVGTQSAFFSPIAGLYACVVGLLVQSLVDFPLRIPSNALSFFAVLGFQMGIVKSSGGGSLESGAPGPTLRRRWPGGAAGAIVVLGLVVCGMGIGCLLVSQRYLSRAREEAIKFSWDRAREAYEGAARLAPLDAAPGRGLGQMLLRRLAIAKEKEALAVEAAKVLELAVAKAPRDHEALQGLAEAYAVMGQKEGAERSYSLSLAGNPSVRDPYLDRGYFLLENGMILQATRDFRYSLKIAFGERAAGSLENMLAKTYAKSTKYSILSRIVPDEYAYTYELARFLLARGDTEGFDEASAKTLELSQDTLLTATHFLQWVSARGDQKRMIFFANKVIAMDPFNDNARAALLRVRSDIK